MKTGSSNRDYTTTITKWIVEGFSDETNRYVYPHQGWSWTEWKSEITDTYDSFSEAKSSISSGYLKDMIEEQQIRDIRIYEVITDRVITETKTVRGYDLSQNTVLADDDVTTRHGVLYIGEYIVLQGDLYCKVRAIKDNLLYLSVINGRWELVLDITDPENPIISKKTRHMERKWGTPISILHVGAPDPERADDYNHQLQLFNRQN